MQVGKLAKASSGSFAARAGAYPSRSRAAFGGLLLEPALAGWRNWRFGRFICWEGHHGMPRPPVTA
jgi:hypothetical protein